MPKCPKCGSATHQAKIGFTAAGSQRYKCRECACAYTPAPKPKGYPKEIRQQAVRMYLDGLPYRRIGRLLGVNHVSVMNWVKAYAEQADKTPAANDCTATVPDVVELRILPSKLIRPVPPRHIVDRPRLYIMLDQWQTMPVVFVHAPAGYGKSTLVSRWLEVRGLDSQTAWLSLGPADDEPVRFVRHLAAALEAVAPGIADAVRPLLDTPDALPLHVMEALLAILQSGLHEPEDAPLLLVLDDLHHVDSPALTPLMTIALEHGPPWLYFILLSRSSTYGPLSRLYAAGQVVDVATSELCFQADEMEIYLSRRGFPRPAPETLTRLAARTEGWIVALQLAATAAGSGQGIDELLAANQRPHAWLTKYATNQILAALPPPQRIFLLKLSILEHFNVSLAAAVTDTQVTDAQLLSTIEAGLPVVQLDNRQEWFRFHLLFQELLQARLQQEVNAVAITILHRRAATWLLQHNEIPAAVQHALAADDLPLAASILETTVRSEILRGGTQQAHSWLAIFPPAELDRHPRLLLDLCLLGVLGNQPNLMDLIARTEAALVPTRQTDSEYRHVLAEFHVFKAIAHFIQGDIATAEAISRRLVQHLPNLDLLVQGMLAFLEMHLMWSRGEGRQALDKGFQTSDTFQRAHFARGMVSVRREQALISAHRGRPREALALLKEIVQADDAHDSFTIREVVSAHLSASNLLYWTDDLEGAQRHQQSALLMAERLADPVLSREIASLNTLFALARADRAAVTEEDQWPMPTKSTLPLLNRLHLHKLVLQEQVERAWHFAAVLSVTADSEVTHSHLQNIASYLEATVARGLALDVVAPLFTAAIAQAEEMGSLMLLTKLRALSAWRHLRLGQHPRALDSLACALDLAVTTGYVRYILDIPAFAPLLAEMDHPAATRMWLLTVADALRQRAAQLTVRERQVFAHLTQPVRYQDIAERLGISINTVRTHVRHIYAKLGVTSRKDAVARAHAMGLVTLQEC